MLVSCPSAYLFGALDITVHTGKSFKSSDLSVAVGMMPNVCSTCTVASRSAITFEPNLVCSLTAGLWD